MQPNNLQTNNHKPLTSMDKEQIRQIEREGADALLDAGVSVPLKSVRLPFFRKPVTLRVTMRRPSLAGQIRFARIYLTLGVTSDEMWGWSKEDELRFMADHGKALSRMVACTLRRGLPGRLVPLCAIAWLVRHFMEHEYLVAAVKRFVSLMGTEPFTSIIRSAEMTNPMKLRLSRERKGS